MSSKQFTPPLLLVFALAPSIHVHSQQYVGEYKQSSERIQHLRSLGMLYGELYALNESLLSELKVAAEGENHDAMKAVWIRKTDEYDRRFSELMQLAKKVPDSDLARDSAILTLNTTFQAERDDAIDLLLEHHIDSPRIREAVTCLTYTGRSETICRKVLETNTDPGVVAHAEIMLASDRWERSDEDREHAKETLWRLVQNADGILYHEGGMWGLNRRKVTIAQVAAEILHEIRGNESVKIGSPFEDFESVDLDGNSVRIKDYRGKVTLIVFWATWCGPCLEMTELEQQLVDQYAEMPFAILGVCGDDELNDRVKQIAVEHKMTWSSIHDFLADGSRLSDRFGTTSWPYCILVDRDGIVRQKVFPNGVASDEQVQLRAFQIEIEKLLPEYARTSK
jgi:thiol-disulfide isomerase/thioredoxin